MDEYIEQKVAELTRAQSHCAFLEGEYLKAQKAWDTYSRESDCMLTIDLAVLVMEAREEKSKLEDAVEEAQSELEEPSQPDGEEEAGQAPYSEFSYLVFNRYTLYVYIAGFVLVGIIGLCATVGQ